MIDESKICPCCREHTFEMVDFYEICPVCGWEDDPIQRDDPDYKGGANHYSLNEYRKIYLQKKREQDDKKIKAFFAKKK